LLIKEVLHVFCAALDKLALLGEAPRGRRGIQGLTANS
jgi:hypothetical protein